MRYEESEIKYNEKKSHQTNPSMIDFGLDPGQAQMLDGPMSRYETKT